MMLRYYFCSFFEQMLNNLENSFRCDSCAIICIVVKKYNNN